MKLSVQNIAVFFLLFAFAKAYSQETPTSLLTKEEAIRTMLENNFGILLANNQVAVAENNTGILNTGYLPTISTTAGINYNVDNQEATFQDGTSRSVNGAETTRYNASVNLDYTLFDGLGRYYNYKTLKEQYGLSKLQARETIENVMVQLFTVYYEVARVEENLGVLENALEISKERELRAQYQFDYGQVNKLEVLNAQVDIVTDSTNILNARQQLRNAQRDLNVVLARELEDLKVADTTVAFINPISIEEYINEGTVNNISLLQSEQNIIISDYQIKQAKSLLLPTVGITGSYGWNEGNFPATNFLASSTSTGFQTGATLRWNLFDGGSTIVGIKNAKIALDSQEYIKEQLKQQVERDISNAKGNYYNALAIYNLQEQNVITSKANFDRSEERFKLGQITSIEFRQAQLNLLNAQTTKNAAKYTAKLAEIQLLQLTGQLLNVDF
ncbi:TolC family protein [uncultured Dokdonia sp.]|jgi:outer membrane protein|uniref:TolC family protein n=1 Tax=uncultured Dokdonia sp. TaxID=575653 RepID=UPI0030EF0478|tara:strand:- start:2578 stop:3912 length:1335 start_codon:yes stop_codon:yes gene_type:complete